ncbi:MAG: YgfZ/GcvT domain-containing protein, partial [Bryobacteraceae bacterium]
MTPGYQALHEGAAILDLSARGKILMRGEDRARLLHAMSTNHIQQLQPGQGCYVFFLNAQGRILADAWVLCLADALLLDTEPETREKLYQHLDSFIIADDVQLEDATPAFATIAVEGPRASGMLEGLPASATGAPGRRVFVPVLERAALVENLKRQGAVPATGEDVRLARVENRQPRYGEDITEVSLPQETQLMHALNFSKGCYLGQEIVERIRSRGHVNKLLAGLEMDGDPPAPGVKITPGGEITSSIFSARRGKVVALG